MERRKFIRQTTLASGALLSSRWLFAGSYQHDFPVVRVPESSRRFKSPAVEKRIEEIGKRTGNKELAWLFGNCFPNTLDTTVEFEQINGKPDTFVITGDIDAMWLRDSSAQVWPYLPLVKEDKNLQELIKGVINRQVKCILKDPYANAFYKDEHKVSEWKADHTTMKPGVHERKWEIDSLCYPIRLAHGYWKETGDITPFDNDWRAAVQLVIQTFKEQQRLENNGPYKFQRDTSNPTDSVPLGGYGYPAKKTGLIHAMFRPSDDATVFPFNIPGNLFAVEILSLLAGEFGNSAGLSASVRNEAAVLAKQIKAAINKFGKTVHPKFGEIYAYEVNGAGSYNLMDDANIPSLLSLPYLVQADKQSQQIIKNTRAFILSEENPFFFKGSVAAGIGGPHVGMDYIWPMGIIMRGLTSTNEQEIRTCLETLRKTHAGKGFMHEAFHKDDAARFTRSWFAWANTLFGEFVWKIYKERPHLLS